MRSTILRCSSPTLTAIRKQIDHCTEEREMSLFEATNCVVQVEHSVPNYRFTELAHLPKSILSLDLHSFDNSSLTDITINLTGLGNERTNSYNRREANRDRKESRDRKDSRGRTKYKSNELNYGKTYSSNIKYQKRDSRSSSAKRYPKNSRNSCY